MSGWSQGTLLSLLVILACTLFPFHIHFSKSSFNSVWDVLIIGVGPDRGPDIVENVLLFLPWGFTLTGYCAQRRLGSLARFAAVLLLSGGISYAIEVIQLFIPERFSSLTDVISNVAGGGLGFVCYSLWCRLGVGVLL
jgi:glycopeptide antibiotics resistance protein